VDVLQALGSAQLCVVTRKEFLVEVAVEKEGKGTRKERIMQKRQTKKEEARVGSIGQGNKRKIVGL
jgi:hypothetical protein